MSEQLWNLKLYILALITFFKFLYRNPILILLIFVIPCILAYFLVDKRRLKKIIIHSVGFIFLSVGFSLIAIHILRLWFIPREILYCYVDNIKYFMAVFSGIFIYYNLYSEYKDYKKNK